MFAQSASVLMAPVINLPMWNLTLINSATCKYCHGYFFWQGTEVPSLGLYPPTVSSPYDRGLLGMSSGTQLASDRRGRLLSWDSGWVRWSKMGCHRHLVCFVHHLVLEALKTPSLCPQCWESGACSPLGTRHQPRYSLQDNMD
jgi:hypothetical protein